MRISCPVPFLYHIKIVREYVAFSFFITTLRYIIYLINICFSV